MLACERTTVKRAAARPGILAPKVFVLLVALLAVRGEALLSMESEAPVPSGAKVTVEPVQARRLIIERIEFSGNAVYTDDELRGEMKSRPRGWPAFIWPGRFDESVFRERDLQQILSKYLSSGYLDAEVDGYWTYNDDLSRITLHVLIYEGKLYTVGDVTLTGNTIFSNKELLDGIPLKPGDPFVPRAVQGSNVLKAEAIITHMYGRQGYVDVRTQGNNSVRAEEVYAEGEPKVHLLFRLEEGEPVFVRLVRIEGLTRTKDLVIRRNLTFYPGERVNTDEFEESKRELLRTGYLDALDPEAAEIFLEPDAGPVRDAVVRVKEGRTGLLQFGVGVGSQTGLMGGMMFQESNFDLSNWPSSSADLWRGNAFRGGGQKLLLQFTAGTKESSYILSLHDPSVGNGPWGLGGSVFSRRWAWDEFDLNRTGADVELSRRFSRNALGQIEVGFESAKMDNVDAGAPFEIMRDKGTYSKPYVALSYAVDRRDRTLLPTEGSLAKVTANLAAGDIETVSLIGEAEKHWPLSKPKGGVLSLSGRAGIVDSYSGNRIPVFERFYAGGIGSLRGFDFRGVSPVEPTKQEQVGGESMLLGSGELRLPAVEEQLWVVLFVDAGYVEERVSDVLSGWDVLRASTGVGVRWQIPALAGALLSVDLGFPVMKESYDKTQVFQFSLGAFQRF
jgi:outer membrane protein insertion porin family